ncbi:hypothetical protein HEP87_11295 [Streptomyces sp. S1D4-11]|nr:hypothetical protein [Streptomyces sp. S1D4-11]QIY94491.1 hypothetical protein HEP87_11295 [Streptomyces sp. S1D4-11]
MAVDVAVQLLLEVVIVTLCHGGGLRAVHTMVCSDLGICPFGPQNIGPFTKHPTPSVPDIPSGLML